jgi:hypothetical protein
VRAARNIRWALPCGILLAAGSLLALDVPQSRREFVEAVASGEHAAKMERFVFERDFDRVYADLARQSSACLEVEVKRSGFVGGQMEVSSSSYHPTLKRLAGATAEFTLQVVQRPRGIGATPPPGGLYVMAADLKSLGKGRTEVVLYRPTIGFKKIAESLKEWAAGEGDDCPKLR